MCWGCRLTQASLVLFKHNAAGVKLGITMGTQRGLRCLTEGNSLPPPA